jgi:poly-D-alanine transfer protein DltD
MKPFILYALVLLFALVSQTAYTQNPAGSKPKLFSNFPEKIICSETELSKVFATNTNQNINLSFSDNFLFSGIVTSNVVKYANLQTAVIKSPAFGDAVFALSKITNTDNSVSYIGRIINVKYFDGYELKKDAHNKYQLIKIETDKVIQVCAHN